jgi:urea transport system permease protein
LLDRLAGRAFIVALRGVRVAPVLNLLVPGQRVPPERLCVALLGKIMCYAICALAMDLIWGYTGILSLGHGLFFALGGYAMGMYLMRQIGRDGNYKSDLPDFMVFLDWKELPWHWDVQRQLCRHAVPGRGWCRAGGLCVRLLRLPLAHQGRVLLHHHAGHDLCRHAAVLPQRDRLWRQQRLHRLQAHPGHSDCHARHAHGAVRADRLTLLGFFLMARWLVRSKFGRVLQAIRDAESRVMFSGYNPLPTSSPSGSSRP